MSTTSTQRQAERVSAGQSAAEAEAALSIDAQGYSKDYWDNVLEQLTRRGLFRLGMSVLTVLYGLAIFAPMLANELPYKLVAVDHGAYDSALRSLSPVARSVLEMNEQVAGAPESERATLLARRDQELEAVTTRVEVLMRYLPAPEAQMLADFEAAVRASATDDSPDPDADQLIAQRALELRESLASDRAGGSVVLEPAVSWPLIESIGWRSIYLMSLWVLLASWPIWNRIWNRALRGGNRNQIRRDRSKKFVILLGVPALVALLWDELDIGHSTRLQIHPYHKAGLTDGSIVPVEPPVFAPISYGYAEIKTRESFRPPTALASATLDEDGYYVHGPRVPKPDTVTGFLPPPTPVEVLWSEPWTNSPTRHIAGTDENGRDFLARMLWGARISLAVGILSALLLTIIGVVMGSLAGYFGGWVDIVIMRLIEVLQAIPAFFLILATVSFIDPDVLNPLLAIVLVIAMVRWTGAARLVRGEFMKLRDQEFVVAARALGFSSTRTIFRHVLPNALSPVLVNAAFAVAAGILTESMVSFLGFGVRPPDASWGSLVNESKSAEYWWIQVFPGFLIFLTVTCYNLVGDAVRDALDPKLKI